MNLFRRLSTLCLVLAMTLALTLPAQARETHYFQEFPVSVPQEAREWSQTPDGEELDRLIKALAGLDHDKTTQEEAAELLDELMWEYTRLDLEYTFCSLDYSRAPQTYTQAYQDWEAFYLEINSKMLSCLQALAEQGWEEALDLVGGEGYAQYILTGERLTQKQQALLLEQSRLISEYWTAMEKSGTVIWNSQSWDQTAILSGEGLTAQEQRSLWEALCRQLNAAAAPIFLELVEVNNELAAAMGYDNYGEYAYEQIYLRDFTMEDAAAFCQEVKDSFVSLNKIGNTAIATLPRLSRSSMSSLLDLTQEEVYELIQPGMERVSDEYARLLQYMREEELWDLAAGTAGSTNTAYTTPLTPFGSAYIYMGYDRQGSAFTTLTHEFGHFANYCLAPDLVDNNEVCEIHSQGLEALFASFAPELAGEAGAAAYRADLLKELVSSVVEGCLYDEFLRAVYTSEEPLTVSDVNRIFRSVAEDYGQTFASDGEEGYSWVLVEHNFSYPFYYLSYSVSAISSLELLCRSVDDFEGAADTYLSLVAQQEAAGYRQAVTEAGLSDVFAAGTVEQIAGDTMDYALSQVLGITDLAGHWGAEELALCVSAGLFQGDEAGRFQPSELMTQAAILTVLWRSAGGPEVSGPLSNQVWYGPAVNWAISVGLIEAKDFQPNTPVTREKLVILLWAVFGPEEESLSGGLTGFSDWQELTPLGLRAMSWAVDQGIVTGKGNGALDPGGTATRAEVAAVLARILTA